MRAVLTEPMTTTALYSHGNSHYIWVRSVGQGRSLRIIH